MGKKNGSNRQEYIKGNVFQKETIKPTEKKKKKNKKLRTMHERHQLSKWRSIYYSWADNK